MKKINLTQGKFALVDDEDYEFLMQWKWCLSRQGYAVRNSKKSEGPPRRQVLMHREIFIFCDNSIDHINGNKLDNRRENLRAANKSQNAMNRGGNINSTSKFKGVSWNRKRRKWVAQIKAKRHHFIGYFDSELDAAIAYNHKALQFHTNFSKINNVMEASH